MCLFILNYPGWKTYVNYHKTTVSCNYLIIKLNDNNGQNKIATYIYVNQIYYFLSRNKKKRDPQHAN